MRILILGGSVEATRLAESLAREPSYITVLSLAGRTRNPVLPPVAYRIGGFGGVAGLSAYLEREAIDVVVNATHPFAQQISANARASCEHTGVPLLTLTRPPWTAQPGDRWLECEDARTAALAIGERPRRVFLTIGRLQLPAFALAPQHEYLIRMIDLPDRAPDLPHHEILLARGPFTLAGELQLIDHRHIEVLVTKNSGGAATSAKLEAARQRGIQVIAIRQPAKETDRCFYDVSELLCYLKRRAEPGKLRHEPHN